MSRVLLPMVLAGCVTSVPCDVHGDCASDEMCLAGTCEPVFDRTWAMDIVSASAGPVHPDGYPWDTDGTPPDLYTEFGIADGDGCDTSTRWDTYTPYWDELCDFYLPRYPTLVANLWDADPTESHGDEFVAGWSFRGEDLVTLLRTAVGTVTVTDPTGSVSLNFELWPE